MSAPTRSTQFVPAAPPSDETREGRLHLCELFYRSGLAIQEIADKEQMTEGDVIAEINAGLKDYNEYRRWEMTLNASLPTAQALAPQSPQQHRPRQRGAGRPARRAVSRSSGGGTSESDLAGGSDDPPREPFAALAAFHRGRVVDEGRAPSSEVCSNSSLRVADSLPLRAALGEL